MNNYLLIYTGDADMLPKTMAEGLKMMAEWKAWYADMGESLLDMGFPFKPGSEMTDGEAFTPTSLSVAGYIKVQAKSYDGAKEIAKECPLPLGGMIHVFEEQIVPGM